MTSVDYQMIANLAVLCGMTGGVLVLALVLFVQFLAHWFKSRYLHLPLPAIDRQSGRMRVSVLLWLSSVLIALLAACASPAAYPERFPGHAAFLANAQAGW